MALNKTLVNKGIEQYTEETQKKHEDETFHSENELFIPTTTLRYYE